MAYKSIQEMIDDIAGYNARIEEIPNVFEVHNDYLIDGMAADNFIAGYKAYHDLIKQLNADMIASPESFGLVAADKNGVVKPVNQFQFPYLWLFIALARSGEVKRGVLYVSGTIFLEYTKGRKLGAIVTYPRNIDAMMKKLSEYGFEINNYVCDEAADFMVEYKPNLYLLPTIKASTLSRYQEKSIVCDYACFNALMFKTAPKEKMHFSDIYTAKLMPQEHVDRVNAIINEFATIGLSPSAERHHNYTDGWMKFGTYFQFYYGTRVSHPVFETNGIHAIMNIRGLYNHEKYLETLPEKYLNIIKNQMKCRGCRCKNDKCKRKHAEDSIYKCIGCGFPESECVGRRTQILFGEKRIWCDSLGLVFSTDMEDIPYAVDIIANIHGKKRRKQKH